MGAGMSLAPFFFPLTKVSKIFILFFVTKSHPNGYIHVTNDESNKTERFTMETLYREIGEIMGKSENWARVNFYRAKELLLKGCGRDE